MFSERLLGGKSYYFIGIGGVSMSALALLLHEKGARVRGSDRCENSFTERLKAAGIPVSVGEEETVSESDVVYTGAVEKSHPQLAAAIAAGKRTIARAELLGMIAEEYPHVLSVAGCHGKTTTTAMLAHIFERNGMKYTCHIGGEDIPFGNCRVAGDEYFLTEACEFRRSFLTLKSEVAVVLNTDRDHTDCYKSAEEIAEAYAAFAARGKRVVVNADDVRARAIPHDVGFGLYGGDIRAEKLRADGEKYSFTVCERSVPLVRIRLGVVGKMHVYNALAAFAAARLCGLSAEEIRRGLEDFVGVKRRFERVGTFHGTPVVCDYAHHPREIEATLQAAQRICAGNVRLIFQPHTYTRTRDLMDEFVAVLKKAEYPVIYKTYAAREPFDFAGSAPALAARLPEARYVQTPEQLSARLLRSCPKPDDMILALGAGDICDIVKSILD